MVKDKALLGTSTREESGDRGPPGGQSEPPRGKLKPPKERHFQMMTLTLDWALRTLCTSRRHHTHSPSTCCVPGWTGVVGYSRDQHRTQLCSGRGISDSHQRRYMTDRANTSEAHCLGLSPSSAVSPGQAPTSQRQRNAACLNKNNSSR